MDTVVVPVNRTSVGKALEYLISLAKMGPELQGECDGIDALCYHLSASTCNKAILALQDVLIRFVEIEKDRILPSES